MTAYTQRIFHMVGHGHIDPTWLWPWTEGFEEVRATFRSAVDRMSEDPAFTFSASSAAFYEWIERTEPALFDAIRSRVAEGRWELAGGFYIEPDCNIPCGESFVRQGLYAQHYFAAAFGKRARIGFNPDSFGHAGSLPQILAKLGIDAYVFGRPEPGKEKEFPEGATFWWESPDGTRLFATHIPLGYNAADADAKVTALAQYPHLNPDQAHVLCLYGVGNHGGGPTKKAIAQITAMHEDPDAPDVRFSTLAGYVDAFRASTHPEDMPVVQDDLQHHARGCYSAHALLKRLHRQTEHALMTAERFATAAWLLDAAPYPHNRFRKAWLDLLYNQFHDIIAGTSIPSAYEDTRDQIGAARHRAHIAINDALQTISRDIDTTEEGNTFVLVNSLTWPVEQPVILSRAAERTLDTPIHFVDDTGTVVPSQAIRHEYPGACRYAVTAELPATGYRLFHARSGKQNLRQRQRLDTGRDFLENDWWHLEFDPYDGALTRLYDKTRRIEVIERGLVLACLADGSDTWSHDVDGYTAEIGRFGRARLQRVEYGDVLATVQITSHWEHCTAIQEITLYREIAAIDCLVRVNWQAAYTMLKLGFETRVEHGRVTCEAPYGAQVRPASGCEEPGGQWLDITGVIDGLPYGFTLINDGCYGFDARDRTLRQTLLRSPAYAHHNYRRHEAGQGLQIMDQGWHTWRFRLLPHPGPWQEARVVKDAWELNVTVFAHHESAHPGRRPAKAQLLGTEADNVLLSTLKQSEEDQHLIVRGYETAGRPASTTLHLPYMDKQFNLGFEPHEIKTMHIDTTTWTLRDVNLLEE
ncbi:MAG: alpha-mannosidase [Candidatus Hydrogenedentota bacterium]